MVSGHSHLWKQARQFCLNPSYTGKWSRGLHLITIRSTSPKVLTLLILENGLGEVTIPAEHTPIVTGLNPSYTGKWSRGTLNKPKTMATHGLNPSYTGKWSRGLGWNSSNPQPPPCLNPSYTGKWSRGLIKSTLWANFTGLNPSYTGKWSRGHLKWNTRAHFT